MLHYFILPSNWGDIVPLPQRDRYYLNNILSWVDRFFLIFLEWHVPETFQYPWDVPMSLRHLNVLETIYCSWDISPWYILSHEHVWTYLHRILMSLRHVNVPETIYCPWDISPWYILSHEHVWTYLHRSLMSLRHFNVPETFHCPWDI